MSEAPTVGSAPAPVDFARAFLALRAGGNIETLPHTGITPRLDGYTIGVWETAAPANHRGEMHPDGDEFLFVISGNVEVEIYGETTERITIPAGQGHVVPRNVWHKVIPHGLCRILFATPGPTIKHRRALSES